MGKKQRNQRQNQRNRKSASYYLQDDEQQSYPLTQPPHSDPNSTHSDEEPQSDDKEDQNPSPDDDEIGLPSKFSLYQQSVQSPKGDISYLQKFFLTYVGGRAPLHLQEDFCGTALLSTEWLRIDSRRTAIGLDLDVEALDWCMDNNVNKVGTDLSSRIFLYHGNVLKPHEAKLVKSGLQKGMHKATLEEKENSSEAVDDSEAIPPRDIVCAFNYSCCCLHSRHELVTYFQHALRALSKKGGIFVMDLYGGTSSECELRMQRRFPNFTYTWEQAGFDIVQRKTRISLHFTLQKHQKKKLRHAFSYDWRLLKIVWNKLGFGLSISGSAKCQTARILKAWKDLALLEISSTKKLQVSNNKIHGTLILSVFPSDFPSSIFISMVKKTFPLHYSADLFFIITVDGSKPLNRCIKLQTWSFLSISYLLLNI